MTATTPTIRLVFDRKNKSTNSKVNNPVQGLVQLEVAFLKDRKFFSSGVKVYRDQWKGEAVTKHPQAQELNGILDLMKSKARRIVLEVTSENNGVFALDLFRHEFEKSCIDEMSKSVFELIEQYILYLKKAGRAETTVGGYHSMLLLLEEYRKIRTVRDVTPESLISFYNWCANVKQLKGTTIDMYFTKFSTVISNEVYEGRLDHSPFESFNHKRKKKKQDEPIRYMTEEEMERFVNYVPLTSGKKKAKDIFLLQMYTGMAYCDAITKNLYRDFEVENGRYVLRARRQKTDVPFTVVLFRQAVEILERYEGQLPQMSIQNYDRHLKDLGMAAIGRRISSHDARHTFATWAMRNGVPIETISSILGHSNIRQTQHYAKILALDVIDKLSSVEDRVIDGNSRPTEAVNPSRCFLKVVY